MKSASTPECAHPPFSCGQIVLVSDIAGRAGEPPKVPAIVLRRLTSSPTPVYLVAELSEEPAPAPELELPLSGPECEKLGLAPMKSFVRFDRLRTVPAQAVTSPFHQRVSEDTCLGVMGRWQAMALAPDAGIEGSGRNDHLPFALPEIGLEELSGVCEVLSSGWLTTGPKASELERKFAGFIGCRHALAVNSCTSGLHLALEAAGIGPGDSVITTPYTFTATAEVIRYLGAEPLFVDIDPHSFNIDPDRVQAQLRDHGPKVRALLPVHFAGQACDMDRLMEIATDHGLKVIEDAAHALPTTYKGKTIGTIADATVFSFYATKTITTGEGGMVTTSDSELAERMQTMRLHGIDRSVFDRYTSTRPSWYYEVVAPGFKYNMPDVAAALGLAQLTRARDFQRRREQIATAYSKAFQDLPLRVPHISWPEDTHAWHLYVIQLDLDHLTIDRDRFIELMANAGIGTSVHFIPLHMQPYWRDRYRLRAEDFPIAREVYCRAVSLPIYSRMDDDDVGRVIEAVRTILGRAVR